MLAVEFGERRRSRHIAGRDEMTRAARRRRAARATCPSLSSVGEMGVERGLGLGVDHRPDVGGQQARIADAQRLHRARRSSPASCRRHRPGRTARASAEQRCPADWNDEATTSRVTCSGKRRAESTIMTFWPPVSAISGMIAPGAVGERAVDRARGVGRSGEGDAGDQRMRGQRGADLAVAGDDLDDVARDAGLVHQFDRQRADQRGLLGRLGDRGIARGERRGDRADEDGEREIPRADAGEHAAAVEAKLVELAGRAREAASARRTWRAPRWRNSAGNRPPRALRARRREASCRPRGCTARRARRDAASNRSAARSSKSARARRRRAGPIRAARHAAARTARSTSAVARVGDRADDDRRCRTARRPATAVRAAAERRRRAPLARSRACARRSTSGSRTSGSLRSTPALLRRAVAEDRVGQAGSTDCASGSIAASSATGSRTSASTGTSSSAMRLTNDELAPFSSKRRTR